MVQMLCMTTKQKFDVEKPEVVQLANGRYAYKAECPWKHSSGKTLTAWKFASTSAYREYSESLTVEAPESEPEVE